MADTTTALGSSSMSSSSSRLAGMLLIVMPTVILGGVSVLSLLITDPDYRDNALRQDLWRAGMRTRGCCSCCR